VLENGLTKPHTGPWLSWERTVVRKQHISLGPLAQAGCARFTARWATGNGEVHRVHILKNFPLTSLLFFIKIVLATFILGFSQKLFIMRLVG
jgi:hypothetical protein